MIVTEMLQRQFFHRLADADANTVRRELKCLAQHDKKFLALLELDPFLLQYCDCAKLCMKMLQAEKTVLKLRAKAKKIGT